MVLIINLQESKARVPEVHTIFSDQHLQLQVDLMMTMIRRFANRTRRTINNILWSTITFAWMALIPSVAAITPSSSDVTVTTLKSGQSTPASDAMRSGLNDGIVGPIICAATSFVFVAVAVTAIVLRWNWNHIEWALMSVSGSVFFLWSRESSVHAASKWIPLMMWVMSSLVHIWTRKRTLPAKRFELYILLVALFTCGMVFLHDTVSQDGPTRAFPLFALLSMFFSELLLRLLIRSVSVEFVTGDGNGAV
ncbi:hypothetical protein PSPO01_09928 [Paraphaeosphaeria sporulosa]